TTQERQRSGPVLAPALRLARSGSTLRRMQRRSRSSGSAVLGHVDRRINGNFRALAKGGLAVRKRSPGVLGLERLQRCDAAAAIRDDDGAMSGGVPNPAPRLQVQLSNRDRLHVHIVTHLRISSRHVEPVTLLFALSNVVVEPSTAPWTFLSYSRN